MAIKDGRVAEIGRVSPDRAARMIDARGLTVAPGFIDAHTHIEGSILDLPAAHIRVIAAPVGGGFGGKLDPFAHEIAACRLSQITGRPVKIALTREEVFYIHRGRHPVLMWT